MDARRSLWLEHEGLALHAVDFGGSGPPVLLLHGLAGYAGEWAGTASWLTENHRAVAPDQRGHGESTRSPPVVTPDAFVGDVIAWIDRLQLAELTLIGQSYGGLIAILTAGAHPDRFKRLVIAEASPAPDPHAEPDVRAWLESWPRPFPDESAALEFFGDTQDRARAWVEGLEEREDGLWPRFDPETLLAAVRESAGAHWEAWDSIRCPTLIVRGEHGMPAEEAQTMVAHQERAVVATVPDAGHDVHLEQATAWRAVVELFLAAG